MGMKLNSNSVHLSFPITDLCTKFSLKKVTSIKMYPMGSHFQSKECPKLVHKCQISSLFDLFINNIGNLYDRCVNFIFLKLISDIG